MDGNRSVAGVEPANPSESGNRGKRDAEREAFRLVRAAKAALEARGCWRLTREIDDELARWDAEEAARGKQLDAFGEGERGGEALHGQNPQDAEVDPADVR